MNERRFQVEVAPAGSGRVRIILAGDLDVAADDALADGYRRVASGPRSSEIVLDFHDVGYINSTGIALIVRLLADWTPPFPGCFLYHPSRRHVPPPLRAFIDFARRTA